MELFAKSKDPDWDRIVHIKVAKACTMAELVSDSNMLKLLIVNEGRVTVNLAGVRKIVIAPALICLSDEEVSFSDETDLDLTIVYFRGTEVRDEFTMERISSGELDNEMGRTIYQDYLLVKGFVSGFKSDNICGGIR